MTAGSGKMGTGTSWESLAVVWRPRQAKALMASKEQNELLFGSQEHVKTRCALSFFFDGLELNLLQFKANDPGKSSFQEKKYSPALPKFDPRMKRRTTPQKTIPAPTNEN